MFLVDELSVLLPDFITGKMKSDEIVFLDVLSILALFRILRNLPQHELPLVHGGVERSGVDHFENDLSSWCVHFLVRLRIFDEVLIQIIDFVVFELVPE